MNPHFSFQPCPLPSNNNVMMNMNGMQMPLNFPMEINVGGFQQQTPMMNTNNNNMSFGMDMNNMGGFQEMPALATSQPPMVSADNSSSSNDSSSSRSFVAERKPLAADFVPGPYDVICARGSAAANSPGNLKFRKTIQDFLPEYSKATTKLEKSLLVTAIVDSVRDKTPNGGFVKKFGNRWFEVGDAACREKIGQCLRDQLHTKYKSSTKAKKPRRKELKELKKKRQQQEKKAVVEPEPLKIPSLGKADAKDDENEMSLTNIFYSAMVDEGLNLDNILRC